MSRPWFGGRGPRGRSSAGGAGFAGRTGFAGRDLGFARGDFGGTGTETCGAGAPAPADDPVCADAAAPLVTIDALGRKCPIPVIWLAEQIRDVPVGAIIAVLADDPAAYSDIPAWCSLKSHDCVFRADLPSGWSFGVCRRY